jgi:colanic acid/amylovoran biosynthesis glycosyltransferase
VPAGDVDALARAMIDCLAASADTLTRMGEAARTRVLARHDVDIEAAKLAGLFAASTAARASPRAATVGAA